ncbi:uncharacterized protein LOC112571623 isoform X1 [Pomacea canaliculata]|uniref:uncharacterized protein LOC112571623 isoform X1 n=1 Tax=Pomacea canaliculata TaxID=400727 RepID=UPI000D735237|nr:uncharacterized protein LOC112571623 isoform X1 [Pomacea canaliculata]
MVGQPLVSFMELSHRTGQDRTGQDTAPAPVTRRLMCHSGVRCRVATMSAFWLFAVCLWVSLGEPVGASVRCTYRVTMGSWESYKDLQCDYGCCLHDCCTYDDHKKVTTQTWTYVGVCLGAVFVVSLIVSVVIYFYRRHRLRKRDLQYGRFRDPGNTTTVTTNHI